MHHPKVRDAILPGASYAEFIEYMDIDAATVFDKATWEFEALDAGRKIYRDQWGAIVQFTSEEVSVPREPAFKSEKDVDRYVPPDPDLPWRYERLQKLVEEFKGQRAVIAAVTDVFNIVSENMLGNWEYFQAVIKNPDFIERVNDILIDYNLGYIRNCIDVGVDVILIPGDWATTNGPMLSPESTAKLIVPPYQKMVEYVHSRGLPCLKHSDGNIWRLFDMIVEAGTDGIHPIDPDAGMDIGEAKAKYGDKICLLGNVSCHDTLSWGTEQEVRRETKEVIRKAGKGGGLICMSSNSIHSGIKPENYMTMVKAIREYGKYPLSH
jgi:uroporphyrinogen decarboxylase